MATEAQICIRCIMDSSIPDILFDRAGVCSYCTAFLRSSHKVLAKDSTVRSAERKALISEIKRNGRRRPYDCIIGVSGGVDSSWVLVNAVKAGLRPLAVHMDNGWNSELAQNNIANLVRGLKVDLYTHVINWREYRGLMQAFFDADVIDIELLYDNAMLAVNYQQAATHGVKFILAGTNQATEGMQMPRGWNWFKYDKKNISSLAKSFGNLSLETFPSIGTMDYVRNRFIFGRRWISFLDFFEYKKSEALECLESDFGYKRYPYKHYESIFTRFYQGYILPNKFGVDKRKLHLSTLIAAGQMDRSEALKLMARIPYPSVAALEEDKNYFIKKMGWSLSDLESYLARPEIRHDEYPSENGRWDFYAKIYKKTFLRAGAV